MYNSKEEKVGDITLEFYPITVREVGEALNPNKFRAIIEQKVTTKYPAARGGNSLQDALFGSEEFGGQGSEYENTRVAFIDVPLNSTSEQVQAKLDQLEAPKLTRILSLFPILTDEQKRTMQTGLNTKTIEEYKESQAVRDPQSTSDPKEKVLWKEHEQYRVIVFQADWVEDIDHRASDLVAIEGSEVTATAGSPSMAN